MGSPPLIRIPYVCLPVGVAPPQRTAAGRYMTVCSKRQTPAGTPQALDWVFRANVSVAAAPSGLNLDCLLFARCSVAVDSQNELSAAGALDCLR